MNKIVSIVIATKNSAKFFENCLRSIKNQSYNAIEIIIVDGKSTDNTREVAKRYACRVYTYVPQVKKGSFDASFKRNYGATKAKGAYIYWVDADMELPKGLVKEAVSLCGRGAAAVILPEDSFGEGIWIRAKNLERRCYWGDETVECPRFFTRFAWDFIGGLDESLGAGGDDLDLYQKLLERGFTVSRASNIVMHNEGALTLWILIKKHFMYGRDTLRYFYKRPKASIVSYFPIRKGYIRNIGLFASRPVDTLLFLIMRPTEYLAGLLGLLYSLVS